MKFNREKLKALLALEDDALWKEIRAIASSFGFRLPEATPPKYELDQLRAIAKSEKTPSIAEAMSILKRLGGGKA